MKIIHVFHHYYPFTGGLENVVRYLAEGMARHGHEVHVLTSRYHAAGRQSEEMINNVHIHRLKSIRLVYPDLTFPLGIPESVLRDSDIVHGHSHQSVFVLKILEKAKKMGVGTAVHFMALDAFDDHPNPFIRFIGPLYGRRNVMRALKTGDLWFTRSRRDLEILRVRYGVKAEFVPDGVPRETVETPIKEKLFRDRYGVEGPVVSYIGRLHRLKGIDYFIRAVALAVRKEPRLTAVVTGPGDKEYYRGLARKLGVDSNIIFTGFVEEELKIGIIDASAAVVVPSINNYVEVYPMIISEAWARRKPVIATSVGGIPYRVRNMVNGLLVPPRDPVALSRAILALIQDHDLGRRLGEAGRREVLLWDDIIGLLLKTYSEGI